MRTGDFFPAQVGKGGQHANDSKYCRGKTDKLMIWAMNKDIYQIAAGGGEKYREKSKASAGNPAEKMNEPPADEAVAQEVDCIGMQGKGSQQAPPFSLVEDAFAVSSPLCKPEGVCCPGAGYGKKEDQAAHQEKRWWLQQRSKVMVWCGREWRPVLIFGEIAFYFMDCPQFLVCCHQELPVVVGIVNVVGNLNSLQYQMPDGCRFLLVGGEQEMIWSCLGLGCHIFLGAVVK